VGGLEKHHLRLNWVVVRTPPFGAKWVGAELVALTSCVQRMGARVDSWSKAITGVKRHIRRVGGSMVGLEPDCEVVRAPQGRRNR